MVNQRNDRVDFLDYMRVFAFSSVLLSHIFQQGILDASTNLTLHISVRMLADIVYNTCYAGAIGVVVFFMTSGYIITHVLQKEMPLEFGIKRVFRIYPLYIIAVLLEILVSRLNGVEVPPLSVIIPRLLLIGDFFHTPYALVGVEWTLRVEIMFYVLMGFLRLTGILNFTRLLPLLYLGIAFLLYRATPFPSAVGFSYGYLGLYGPYLFIGSIIYLYEKKLSGLAISALCVICIMAIFLTYTTEIKVALKESNHGILALLIFLGAWVYRARFTSTTLVKTLSQMTYAIYLFHLWLWKPLAQVATAFGPSFINVDVQVFVMLFTLCFVMCKTIEHYGIDMGRRLVAKVYKGTPTRLAVPV